MSDKDKDNKNLSNEKNLSSEDKFKKLNTEYQRCLNSYYDKFFENTDDAKTNYSEVCNHILAQMKEQSDIYPKMMEEFNDFNKKMNSGK